MRLPSGDQLGVLSAAGSLVSRTRPEPSAFTTYISQLPSRSLANAMRDAAVAAVSALGVGGTRGRVGSSVQLAANAAALKRVPTVLKRTMEPPYVRCTTRTGVRLVTVVPLPSWPTELSPQSQHGGCHSRSHGEIVHCATGTGVELRLVVPSPSGPLPQQYAAPLVVTPQV